jgi:2-keto-3-deoxy-L-rhamnonate aldolase RhmA
MALKLMYITNNEDIAMIAESCGVDWVFIDLEIIGKEERQGHLDTVISRHRIDDVKKIANVLTTSELLVRVNPLHAGSKSEIDRVINDGADIVMLPFFQTRREVETFVKFVDNRVKTMLLLETPEAVKNLDEIIGVDGIDYIHIGLNDLHLGYGMKFMFELLADGTVEKLCEKISKKGVRYGFGGIARLGKGTLPAELIIAEHYRLGSSMVILSRSFCNVKEVDDMRSVYSVFREGVVEIREYEKRISNESKAFFARNQELVVQKVNDIKNSLG